jgi:hypothetical protein
MPSARGRRSDITQQFFTAGELMELTGDTSRIEGYAIEPRPRWWVPVAALSALGLLLLVVFRV